MSPIPGTSLESVVTPDGLSGIKARRIVRRIFIEILRAARSRPLNEAREHGHIAERMRAAPATSRGVKLADGSETVWHNRAAANAHAEVKAWPALRGYPAQFPVTLSQPS